MDVAIPVRPACPFPGLRPFRRGEDALFFGRDREVGELRRALLGAHRFVAVVGTSGCGKSSLVEAGLLPGLLAGEEGWRVLSLRPLGSPIVQLAEALAAFARVEQPEVFGGLHGSMLSSRFRATLRRTTDGLKDAILEVVADSGAPVLVFIDQFEELFRYEPDQADQDLPLFRDEAQTFTNLLLAAIRAEGPRIHVLITMRSDFFGECGRYRGLAEAVSGSHFLVPRMVREQLQEAITGPLCVRAGILRDRWPEVLEPALLQRLLNAVGDEATADPLPVMQHALMRAWQMAADAQEGDGAVPVLRVPDYVAAGEIAEALSRHADEVLARAVMAAGPGMPPDGPGHLFRALTDIDREGRAIRRPQSLAELAPVVGAPMAELVAFLDVFRAYGVSFLTPYSPAPIEEATPIDISHEALIRRWVRIADQSIDSTSGEARGWLQQEFRDGLTWRALAVQAEVFAHNPEACLDPATTGQRYPWFRALRRRPAWALRYAIQRRPHGDPAEAPEWLALRALLLSSLRRKRDERRALRAAAREANRRAASARRARNYAYAVAAVVVVLSGVAGVAGWSAYGFARRARAAESSALVALSDAARALGRPQDALKLALAAWPRKAGDAVSTGPETGRALIRSIGEQIEAVPEMRHERAVRFAVFRPDGGAVVTAESYGPAHVWDLRAGKPTDTRLGADGISLDPAITRDGTRLLTATADEVRLWDPSTVKPAGPPLRHPRGRIRIATFAGAGERVLTATDAEAQLWDAATGAAIGGKLPQAGIVRAVLDSGGTRVVTLSLTDGLVLWRESNGAFDRVPLDHPLAETQFAITPDGRFVAAASLNSAMRYWDGTTGKPILQQSAMQRENTSLVAFSPDGTRVLTLQGRDVRQWNAVDGSRIGSSMPHANDVQSQAYSPDGRFIVTTTRDDVARLWTAASGKPVGRPMRHEGPVSSVAFSPDGSLLVTTSRDRRARLWSTETAEPLGPPLWHDEGVNSAVFSPDGKQVLTASNDKMARLWDVPKLAMPGRPVTHGEKVWSAAFDDAGTRVVTASWDGTVGIWGARDLQRTVSIGKADGPHFNSAAFSLDGRLVVTGSQDKTAHLWRAADGASVGRPLQHEGEVWTVEFSRDGTKVLTASADQSAAIWDVATGARLKVLTGHDGEVSAATFDRLASRVATSSDDGTVRLWDAGTTAQIAEIRPNDGHANSVAFSPDGAFLAVGLEHGASIWDTGKQPKVVMSIEYDARVASVAFSPDGTRLLTGAFDHTARLWDVATGVQIGQPMRHDETVYAAAFSRSGTQVVTASEDKTARIWQVDERRGSVGQVACGMLPERRVGLPVIDLDAVSKRYGFPIREPICVSEPPVKP